MNLSVNAASNRSRCDGVLACVADGHARNRWPNTLCWAAGHQRIRQARLHIKTVPITTGRPSRFAEVGLIYWDLSARRLCDFSANSSPIRRRVSRSFGTLAAANGSAHFASWRDVIS